MNLVNFALRFLTISNFSKLKKDLEYITKSYFSGESLLFAYWSNVSTDLKLMDYLITSEIVTVVTCNCEHVTDDVIEERSQVKNTFVVFGDLVPERRHFENMKQCLSWNPRSKVLAIVDSVDVVNITLNNIWAVTKAMNVTVMASENYYTLYPYENFKIVKLTQKQLFLPKQLKNLNGSLIHVAMAPSPPYILPAVIPRNYTEGTEFRLLNLLAEKLNFKWDLIQLPEGQSPYVVMANGKPFGNMGALHRCEADIAAYGAQIRIDRHLLADYTAIHTIDKMVWVVPVRPFTFTWKSIIIVFQKELWGLIGVTLIMTAIMLYLITVYEFGYPGTSFNIYDAFFQSFGINLGVPIHFYRKRQLYRLFIFIVSYYTLITIALYQSSLITYLTTPGSGTQYKTIREAVDDGLIGYIYPSLKLSYNLTDHDLWNKILSPGRHIFHEWSNVMMSAVAHNNCYTLMMYNVAYFETQKNLLDENHKPMVNILPETFLPYMVTIFTSKGHPLRDAIESIVLRLIETGMMIHWMRDVALKNLQMYGKGKGKGGDDGPLPLTVEQLRGAFFILVIFLSIAGVVFVGEICYYWYKVWKKRRRGTLMDLNCPLGKAFVIHAYVKNS